MNELLQPVVLGILQGIFEWLPVSSEAVITLVSTQFFGVSGEIALGNAVFLHIGTLLAATVYFREELFQTSKEFFREKDLKGKHGFIVIATLVTGIVGGFVYILLLENVAGNQRLFTGLMGVALVLTGLTRFYSEGSGRTDFSYFDGVFIGFLQGLAVIPGVSRSGSTVFGLFIRDFDTESAFRLSFLLSVPAVLAANIGLNLFEPVILTFEIFLAVAVSFFVGICSIDIVLKMAERFNVATICFVLAALAFGSLLI